MAEESVEDSAEDAAAAAHVATAGREASEGSIAESDGGSVGKAGMLAPSMPALFRGNNPEEEIVAPVATSRGGNEIVTKKGGKGGQKGAR